MDSNSSEKNLILVRQNGCQSQEDFEEIASEISKIAPEIQTFVVNGATMNSLTRKRAANAPTLVVSFRPIERFRPLRGRIYQGGYIAKPEQMSRMKAAGISVPRSAILEPDINLDPRLWGQHVIIKPLARGHSSHGMGVALMRTTSLRFMAPDEYPEDHPGRHGPMFVQSFIDSGKYPCVYRVLTLFGEPLYSFLIKMVDQRPSLDSSDTVLAKVATNSGRRTRRMVLENDVLNLAREIYPVFPEIPLQAIDIIREQSSQHLFALEINAGGNTWQFSSQIAKPMLQEMGGAKTLINQLDAFKVAARTLVAKVKAEAE